jgi:hypothetical protein
MSYEESTDYITYILKNIVYLISFGCLKLFICSALQFVICTVF